MTDPDDCPPLYIAQIVAYRSAAVETFARRDDQPRLLPVERNETEKEKDEDMREGEKQSINLQWNVVR